MSQFVSKILGSPNSQLLVCPLEDSVLTRVTWETENIFSVLLPDPLLWVAPTSQITVMLSWKTVSRQPSRAGNSWRSKQWVREASVTETMLQNGPGGETGWGVKGARGDEGCKSINKISTVWHEDERVGKKRKGWILSRCIWRMFTIKRE